MTNSYQQLIDLLTTRGATYRLLEHPPEGRTEIVSEMRGHHACLAAKCMVVMVKVGRKVTRHILAVVPGHTKVDLNRIKALFGGTYVAFASSDTAESLSQCVVGTILPFAFQAELILIVDPLVLANEEMFFNAGRLDRSVALKTKDYVDIANPRVERIADYEANAVVDAKHGAT